MERPAGGVEDAVAGKRPFEFSSAETDALNAAVAAYGILPSKGFVLGALAGAWVTDAGGAPCADGCRF
jgi:hypothetical protein